MEGSEDLKLVELGQCYLPSGELLNAVIAFLLVWSLRGLLRRNVAMYISKNFSHVSNSTQQSDRRVNLTTHLHLSPGLQMSGTLPSLRCMPSGHGQDVIYHTENTSCKSKYLTIGSYFFVSIL